MEHRRSEIKPKCGTNRSGYEEKESSGFIRPEIETLLKICVDGDNIESQLEKFASVKRVDSLKDAVLAGFEEAKSGDSILLAPACASFDMFQSFEERGEVFKNEVAKLAASRSTEAAANGN